jgi:2-iminobutanoate/2-iminopropanoate deaminase
MDKKVILTDKAPLPIGPYSQAIMINGMLFVSGQIAADIAGNHDIKAETKKVMENLGSILHEAGLKFENIVKTTIFLKDMNDFGAVNETYGSFFGIAPPARETVQVARLPKDVNVEISAIAVVSTKVK